MKGGGPETDNKFAEILENAYRMFTNILEFQVSDGNVSEYQTRLVSNLTDLGKLEPLLDRFTLLKDILTTIYNYRLKPRDEFIRFLSDENPVIHLTFPPINVESNLKLYAVMLNYIMHIYNNFKNKHIYEIYRKHIHEFAKLLKSNGYSSELTNQLMNIQLYFDANILRRIEDLQNSGGGKKKRLKKKRSIKKRSIKKKRSKKKRH